LLANWCVWDEARAGTLKVVVIRAERLTVSDVAGAACPKQRRNDLVVSIPEPTADMPVVGVTPLGRCAG